MSMVVSMGLGVTHTSQRADEFSNMEFSDSEDWPILLNEKSDGD